MNVVSEMLDALREEVGEEWCWTIWLAAIAYQLAGAYVSASLMQYVLARAG